MVGLAPLVRESSEPQAGLALLLHRDLGDGGELGARVDAVLQQTRERRAEAQVHVGLPRPDRRYLAAREIVMDICGGPRADEGSPRALVVVGGRGERLLDELHDNGLLHPVTRRLGEEAAAHRAVVLEGSERQDCHGSRHRRRISTGEARELYFRNCPDACSDEYIRHQLRGLLLDDCFLSHV
eukprot:5717085-Pyramimonas_sp.AAC.2